MFHVEHFEKMSKKCSTWNIFYKKGFIFRVEYAIIERK